MEASEPKIPIDGAAQEKEGARTVVTEPAECPPPDAATPQAASISRSRADPEQTGGRMARTWRRLLHRWRSALAIAGGMGTLIGAILAPRIFGPPASASAPAVHAASLAGSVSGLEAIVDSGVADAFAGAAPDAQPAPAPVWRVALLGEDPNATLVEVLLERRPLLAALAVAKLSRGEAQRLADSLGEDRSVDRFGPKDEMTIALDKSTGRVMAYELAASPVDVWQGREEAQPDGSVKLATRKLELFVELVPVHKAMLVGADLHASFVEAGFTPIDDVLAMLDDALEGHAELSDIRPGARLRMVATQEQVNGAFLRWASLEAVEYFPATPNAPSVRVYRFGDDPAGDAKKRHGWYDAKGRQPFHGGWRTPVPLARIASRFNPHRMHPVLHVVMPHNGVDFAAPAGARVYATAAGVVTSMGNDGPCGNKVEISHAGGISSVYCHLSRFASGVHVGLHVEQRQLIAYVGQTGRVTGPHLHFGIRRGGMFIDPMTLRLDGMRVVPRAQRDEFDRQRAQLDAELDGISLPAASGMPAETKEPDNFYEEP